MRQCENRMSTANAYFRTLKAIEAEQKVTPGQALRMMGSTQDPWVARDAAEALDLMSQDEFVAAEMDNCLQTVNERNR